VSAPSLVVGGDLKVGDSSTGTLDITAGGTVSNDTAFIGYGPGIQGTATVSGTSSTCPSLPRGRPPLRQSSDSAFVDTSHISAHLRTALHDRG
jgi:hypothetical protein